MTDLTDAPERFRDSSDDRSAGPPERPGRRSDDPDAMTDTPDLDVDGAIAVLRRGVAATPELRKGLGFTVAMAVTFAAGRIAIPVLIQVILDRGVLVDGGFRFGFVWRAGAFTAVAVAALLLLQRATYLRLIQAAENALFGLRTRAFDHIHRLSMADHTENRRGALVARVTADIEQLARFTQWGMVAWIVNTAVIAGTLIVMLVYSWQLTAVVVACFLPLLPLLRNLQRRQLAAYDHVRETVGTSLSEVSEAVTGAAVVRAYGMKEAVRRRLRAAIGAQYRAHLRAAVFFALLFPLGDLFGSVALAAVAGLGALQGADWGLTAGQLIAFVFLVNLVLQPVAELSEVLDQTQTAIAGWRKVLAVLAMPVLVADPEPGRELPPGPLGVELVGVRFRYSTGPDRLHGITTSIPAGTNVAVVGETGSGKTTLAKLLCRLADPTAGVIRLGGVDLSEVGPRSRRQRVRMVPQDGFLFDTTIAENVRLGRPDATDQDVRQAFEVLELGWWLDRLADGIATPIGERGGNLSVGERQLVALARTQLAEPGLLILDEATSAVDPETEQALARALLHLAEGRTVISIAHRLSTAEAADLVLVLDDGRLVEQGPHHELVTAGGRYSELHAGWVGATRTGPTT